MPLILGGIVLAQPPQGTYAPAGSPQQQWAINEHNTLIWEGQPYLPVGVVLDPSMQSIQKVIDQKIHDVLLKLPASGAGWTEAFQELDRKGMSYLVSLNSTAPMAPGYSVQPQSYRQVGITEPTHIEWPIPGATSALVLFVTKRDSSVEWSKRVPVINGKLILDLKPLNELEHVLLAYPETDSLDFPDFWQGFDAHRDQVLSTLKNHAPGAGFRGFVNPLGILPTWNNNLGSIPSSPYFQRELSKALEFKYKNISTAMRAWGMSAADIETFDKLSTLVPLWSGNRGISKLWDPATDRLYECNMRLSSVWSDISGTMQTAARRRYSNLVRAIRKVVDVPVIQDWAGWASPYNSDQPLVDGIGAHTGGETPEEAILQAARASSSLLQWGQKGWLVATEVDPSKSADPALELSNFLDALTSLGARGCFVKAETPALLNAVAYEAQRRAADTSASQYSPKPVFFPENALNPAFPKQLPNGQWWLPSPVSGDRLELGVGYHAYRIKLDEGKVSYAIWSDGPATRVKLFMLNPKQSLFQSVDGSEMQPRLLRDGVEVTISSSPILVTGISDIPVPEPAYKTLVSQYELLIKTLESRQAVVDDQRFWFKQTTEAFSRNPGGSFSDLMKRYRQLALILGTWNWVEAENLKDSNFSEVAPVFGASGNNVLSLETPLAGTYYAEMKLPVRTTIEQSLWVAARIPAADRKRVRVLVDGVPYELSGLPVGSYSGGLGWYRVCGFQPKGKQTSVRLEVSVDGPTELAVDAFLIAAPSFTPSGLKLPN